MGWARTENSTLRTASSNASALIALENSFSGPHTPPVHDLRIRVHIMPPDPLTSASDTRKIRIAKSQFNASPTN
jgi:hypothetical protein